MTHRTQDGAPLSAGTSSDLRFVPGTNRILLNSQHPIVNRVIVDAIENIRVSLLFLDAFPDAARAAEFTRDGLLTSATKQGSAGAAVYKQLRDDDDYLSVIAPLVRNNFVTMTWLTFFKATRSYLNFQGRR